MIVRHSTTVINKYNNVIYYGVPILATTIQQYLEKATQNNIQLKSKEAVSWFRTNVKKLSIDPSTIMREEKANLVNNWASTGIGQMYMAYYDPKHKETLPYYDRFPLIIPIERYPDGFLGLNLHYLPIPLRARLLDALLDVADDKRMEVSYNLLKSAARYKYFKPCLKRYLGKHFRSRFVKVNPEAWPVAAFLPVEKFEKKSKTAVWKDSRDMI